MTFDVALKNVVGVEKKEVPPTGRISGLSKHKGKIVYIIVQEQEHTEQNAPLNGNITTYGAGIEGGVPQERDYSIKNNTSMVKEVDTVR